MEREITRVERHEDVLSLKTAVGAMYKIFYRMGKDKYEMMLYARDELHAYQKFKEVVGNRTTKRKEA